MQRDWIVYNQKMGREGGGGVEWCNRIRMSDLCQSWLKFEPRRELIGSCLQSVLETKNT